MRLQSSLLFGATLAGFVQLTFADIYLQVPCGNNDRLNEANRNVDNNARTHDSQNNNRGGCNVGEKSLALYAGSILPIQWSAQHACGGTQDNCDLILQYLTDYPAGSPYLAAAQQATGLKLRDGTTTTSPANNADSDTNAKYVLHETRQFYQDCKTTSRNKGLFTSNQAVQNNIGQTSTIQNAAGNQSGQECPEERDYYPWWSPSPWVDVAAITNNQKRCDEIKGNSQNTKTTYKCVVNNNNNKPITEADCKAANGAWTAVAAKNVADPVCTVNTQNSRDNQHSVVAGADGNTANYNWQIPKELAGKNVVLRIRYNISTGEFGDPSTGALPVGIQSIDAKQNSKAAAGADALPVGLDVGFQTQAEANTRQYDLQGNPQVQPFSAQLLGSTQATTQIKEQLAVNTAQWPRTFEERTAVMQILDPSTNPDVAAALAAGNKVLNFLIAGKEGNDVQVYPQVEEQFSASEITLNKGDVLHVQWSLPKNNPANNADNAAAAADPTTGAVANTAAGIEKANIVLVAKSAFDEAGSDPNNQFIMGDKSRLLPADISTTAANNIFGVTADVARQLAIPEQSKSVVIPLKTEGVFPIMSTGISSDNGGQPFLKSLITVQGAGLREYKNSVSYAVSKLARQAKLAAAAPQEGSPLYNSQIVQGQTPASPAYQGGLSSLNSSSASSSGPNYVLIGGIAGGVVGLIVALFFLYTCCLKGSNNKSVASKQPAARPQYAQTYAPVQYAKNSPSHSPRSQKYGTSQLPQRSYA